MAFALTITDPKGRRQHITEQAQLVLGGESGCDLPLVDPTVSRRHLRLHLDGDAPAVEDLGSTNGSWFGSQRLQAGQLTPWPRDQTLKLGETELRWQAIADNDIQPTVELSQPRPPASDRSEAEATLAAGQFDHFYRIDLPALLESVRSASPLTIGRALGEALVRSTQAGALCLEELHRSPPAQLFSLGALSSKPLTREKHGYRIQVDHCDANLPDLEPLLECALAVLSLADNAEETAQTRDPVVLPNPESLEPAMVAIYEQAQRAAQARLNVVINGSTGTGKEVLARFIHLHSRTADRPWVAINCAALPESLLEAELFGIEKGVATGVDSRPGVFEQADQGLLFLDEIADMSLATQARILRVLEDGEVRRVGGSKARPARTQIIAASNRDLDELVRAGEFRRDLFHRLADWRVRLPDLKDRPKDIPNLASWFLAAAADQAGHSIRGLSPGSTKLLSSYDWPGNVRELQREMQRVAAFAAANAVITTTDLAEHIQGGGSACAETLEAQLRRFERRVLTRALEQHDGDVDQSADALGISRATLYRRLKATGLGNKSQD